MLQVGVSSRVIAQQFGCRHSSITRLHKRYQQTGTTRYRPGPGQQRVTTTHQDRHIVRLHIRDRMLPAARTAPTVPGGRGAISAETVCFPLRSAGLRAHRPCVGPILTDRHRNERRRCAGRYRHWRLPRCAWYVIL